MLRKDDPVTFMTTPLGTGGHPPHETGVGRALREVSNRTRLTDLGAANCWESTGNEPPAREAVLSSLSSCEQEMNRVNAKSVGKAVSDHLLNLVRDDDDVVHVLALSPEDQQETLEGARTMRAIARILYWESPAQGSGPPRRDGDDEPTATNDEREMVRFHAARRQLSVALHFVNLAMR